MLYRDFTARKARKLGLVGSVQNIKDGTVKVVAEGSKDSLERFLQYLNRGPLFAKVHSVVSIWNPPSNTFQKFTIIYSSLIDHL